MREEERRHREDGQRHRRFRELRAGKINHISEKTILTVRDEEASLKRIEDLTGKAKMNYGKLLEEIKENKDQ